MTLDVVNTQNEKVGSIELLDALVRGRVNAWLIWESVVHANAAERRGTHATKNRAQVSGSGRKPWRQKGTGRARVGEIRNPLWRKGGTVFGPRPRSYDYRLPRKVELGALRSALAQRLADQAVTVVDMLPAETKTKAAVEMLRGLGAIDKTLVVDVKPDDRLMRAVRNVTGVRVLATGRLTPRDVIGARRLIVTRAAVERWQQVLAAGQEEGKADA